MAVLRVQGVHLHSSHNKRAAALYARNAMLLHVGCVTCDWDRFILPPAHVLSEDQSVVRRHGPARGPRISSLHPLLSASCIIHAWRNKACSAPGVCVQEGGHALGIPVAPQCLTASPYLDTSMWVFDAAHTSASLRLRPLQARPSLALVSPLTCWVNAGPLPTAAEASLHVQCHVPAGAHRCCDASCCP